MTVCAGGAASGAGGGGGSCCCTVLVIGRDGSEEDLCLIIAVNLNLF